MYNIFETRVPTFTATIYVGLKNAETKNYDVYPFQAKKICQDECDKGWCLTFEKTEYLYKNGSEEGIKVGIIQYPRFPYEIEEIKNRTLELAKNLLLGLNQCRVTVVFPDETIMLSNEDLIKTLKEE
jgi:hypothetical protein